MSAINQNEAVLARLDELELQSRQWQSLARQNCRLRRLLVGIVVGLGVAVFAGGAFEDGPRTAVLDQLILQDENGKNRIILGFEKFHKDSQKKIPVLLFLDEQGRRRVMVGGDEQAAGMWLAENAKTRLSITTTPEDFAGMGIFAEPGQPQRGRIGLYYSETGDPRLMIADRNGATRIALGLLDSGKPSLSLNDSRGDSFYTKTEE